MRRTRTGSTWSPRTAATLVALFVGGAFVACSSSSSDDDDPPADASAEDTSTPKETGSWPDVVQQQEAATDANAPKDSSSPDAHRADAAPDGSSIADAGKDTSPPPDAGPPPAASLWAGPALPAFDMATVTHVRQVRATGQTKGNRLAVVAKFGDSITVSPSFLYEVGDGTYTLGSYAALEPTITAIRAVTFTDGKNSFNHVSTGAKGGWRAGNVLTPDDLVTGEVSALQAGYAIVMFGTNNDGTATTLATDLNTIVDKLEAHGTVAIVSTVPTRKDYTGADTLAVAINEKIRTMASQRHLPLIDLFVGLSTLPSSGLSGDNVHPSVEGPGTSANFNSDHITVYGYNVRNLTALQMLDRLRALPQ